MTLHKDSKRVLVCGGRNFGYTPESNYTRKDIKVFNAAIDTIKSYGPTSVIEGKARGGDEAGKMASLVMGIPCETFPADWSKHGRGAGPIRNKQMLVEAMASVWFWYGQYD